MELVPKNADMSVLSNFLAIFSRYREILPSTTYMPNFQINWTIQTEITEGAESAPSPAIPICKKPGLFEVKTAHFIGVNLV